MIDKVLPSSHLKLAACLVNVSCGRQPAAVHQMASAALQVTSELEQGLEPALCDASTARRLMGEHGLRAAATVLSIFSDEDYDRTVITVAAPQVTLGASVLALCRSACGLIDLNHQRGGHPRLGAVDLVPVHPLAADTTLDECGALARAVGLRLTAEVPGSAGFWFGAADPLRRSLPLRRRQLGWFDRTPELGQVDVGAPDSRLGVTGFGAIPYMTNYNVTLDSSDLKLGQSIAHKIRGKTPGGLPGVQAMAFAHRGRVEVACNVDILPEPTGTAAEPVLGGFVTPTVTIERRVTELARPAGVRPLPGSRVVGYTPQAAAEAAWHALRLGDGEAWRSRGAHLM